MQVFIELFINKKYSLIYKTGLNDSNTIKNYSNTVNDDRLTNWYDSNTINEGQRGVVN